MNPALVEEISRLEKEKSAPRPPGPARAAAALDDLRRANETAAGVPRAKQGRGVASEVALARRDSPARGDRHLGFAKALVHEMPHTLAALECGALSEWRATLIVKESACLDVEQHRRALDAEMCADVSKLDGQGDARMTADAKKIAYRLDRKPWWIGGPRPRSIGRYNRPAPDTMTYVRRCCRSPRVWGVCDVETDADTTFDDRSRGAVMADTIRAGHGSVC